MIPDEIRQQAWQAAWKAWGDAGRAAPPNVLSKEETIDVIIDAVLPIIAPWYEQETRTELPEHIRDGVHRVLESDRVRAEKAEAERDDLRDEREDSLSRWHQIAESEADVKRLTEERGALLPLVRWLKEELEQAAIRAHPRLRDAERYALEDLPDNLRATLDAALMETPNE